MDDKKTINDNLNVINNCYYCKNKNNLKHCTSCNKYYCNQCFNKTAKFVLI